jgi:hypothetical protein
MHDSAFDRTEKMMEAKTVTGLMALWFVPCEPDYRPHA